MKPRAALRVRAQSETSLEIDIYDVVGPSDGMAWMFGFETVSAKGVLSQLQANPSVTDIVVRINSAGGDVYDGTAIYSLLKDSKAKVRVQIDGLCASIASVIAMAGDEIVMNEGAWMMVHCPYADMLVGMGADDLRKTADTLDKFTDTMAGVYAARTGRSKDECLADMKAETWMTADEAVEAGYATSIAPAKTSKNDAAESAVVAQLSTTHARLPHAALMAMARAYSGDPSMLVASAVPAKAEDSELDKAKKRAEDAEDRAKKAEEALADYKKKAEEDKKKAEEDKKKAEEDDKARAEFPKKDGDDDEDSTGDADPEARAMAKLCATVVELTGAKGLEDAEAKFVAMAERAARTPDLEKSKHVARVESLIASGHIAPARKAWALAAKPAQIDAYLEATGNAPIVPMGSEHHEDPARRDAAENQVTLTAEDRAVAKQLGLTEAQALEAAKKRAERAQAAR